MRCPKFVELVISFALSLFLVGCNDTKGDPKAEAPAPAQVEKEQDLRVIQVDHPEQFQLATAAAHDSTPQVSATGTVNRHISRSVPVIRSHTGREGQIHA